MCAALLGATLAAILLPAPAAAQAPQVAAPNWILVEAESGDVLAGRAASEPRPVASATKLMTAYLALQELRPAERVRAVDYAAGPLESLMGLRPGEQASVRDLLYGLLLASGNDAAATLAAAASGSPARFVRRMNGTARELGLADTRYADPSGLDSRNVASAADLVDLTLRLRREPLLRRIVDTPEASVRVGGRTLRLENRNTLVHEVPWVDGVKTGTTPDAGFVLVASGERRGVELVAAVLGAASEEQRDAAALALLEYGASLYRWVPAVAEDEVLARTSVALRDERLPLVAAEAVRVSAREGEPVATDPEFPAEVEGPIAEGERVGSATVLVGGEPVERVALLAAREVAAPSLVERADAELPGGRGAAWAIAAAIALLLVTLVAALARAGLARLRAR